MTIARSDTQRFSFSKLQCFEQCPYQYYLTYIQKQPKEASAMAEYGSMCHHLLEQYLKGELELYELPTQYKKRFYKELHSPFPRMFGRNLAPSYFDSGLAFFNNFEGLTDCKILGVEENFNLEIELDSEPFIFNGFVDVIYRDKNNNLVVHDWKSKSGFKNKTELAHYQRQLYLYSQYIYENFGQYPDILRLYCFREQKSYDCPFIKHAFDEAWEWANGLIRRIRSCEIFEQNHSAEFFCNELCAFRQTCEINQLGFLEEE